MTTNEKVMLILVLVIGIFFSWTRGGYYKRAINRISKDITLVKPKREKLEELSLTKERLDRINEKFVPQKNRPLKELTYNWAKTAKLRVISVVPKAEDLSYDLKREIISLDLQGSYDDFMSFVKLIEKEGERQFIYIRGFNFSNKAGQKRNKIVYNINVEVARIILGGESE